MALAASLCVAALTAIAAVVSGDFDDTEVEVLLTSLGFAVFSGTTAPGASLRLRPSPALRALGAATIAFSIASFVLLVFALWTDDHETLWRSFGCAALVAFACSHASLVSAARRPDDGSAIRALCTASIGLGALDAFFGVLAASGAVDQVDTSFVEFVAVLVILLVLTTALQPIARRIGSPSADGRWATTAALPEAPASVSRHPFAAEVLATADRIDALNGDPGNRASEISREVARLRELVRTYG